MKREFYTLSINNLDKKMPDNYNEMVIPAIEKLTENIPGDVLKLKIYNYLIYYYNKNILSGIMPTINIYSESGSRKISYDMDDKNIKLELIRE